ncbi:MAG: ferritin-like domain-containing protein [Pirellulales bacterium]
MRRTRRKPRPPQNRAELLSLLSEACELEHGLTCSYLYTAFTLKQDLREGGLTWEQLQLVRKWAAQIYFVASEEMLHLGQAWNLLAAIGGTPYYLRPNFPQDARYYPIEADLVLAAR